jgi:hypothetical protein
MHDTSQSHQTHHKVMILITKSSNPSQSHDIHHKVIKFITKSSNLSRSICTTSRTSHHTYSSRVADTWLVGVAAVISRSGFIPMWTWSSIVVGWRIQKLNDIKCIVNRKNCYIVGKIWKPTWERYLSSKRQAKRRWCEGWGNEPWHVKSLSRRHLLYML